MNAKPILTILADHEVRFVLVGGLAASLHASTVTTLDTDVCFEQEPENCARLHTALMEMDAAIYPPRPLPEPTPSLLETVRLLHLTTTGGRLDLLTEIEPLGRYRDLLDDSVGIEVYGRSLQVLSVEQLIAVKERLDTPKDREHLDQLRHLLGRDA